VHGACLELPLSHGLPDYLQRFPLYDSVLHRLSEYLHKRDGSLICIDVGANIGDTIAACFRSDNDKFLAVEPNSQFNRYLCQNFGKRDNVQIVKVMCSSKSLTATFTANTKSGTSSFTPDSQGTKIQTQTLDSLIYEYPTFANVNMLKVDTDGHDIEVIKGAADTIRRRSPVILFECDAFGRASYAEDCCETLATLKDSGYGSFLIYDNLGNLNGRHSLSVLAPFRDLLRHQLLRTASYFDLLLMPESDIQRFYSLEKTYFRGTPAPTLQRDIMSVSGSSRAQATRSIGAIHTASVEHAKQTREVNVAAQQMGNTPDQL
jgi:FkbM family methyltransferase